MKNKIIIGFSIAAAIIIVAVLAMLGKEFFYRAYDEGGGAGQGEPTNLPDLVLNVATYSNNLDKTLDATLQTINVGEYPTTLVTHSSLGIYPEYCLVSDKKKCAPFRFRPVKPDEGTLSTEVPILGRYQFYNAKFSVIGPSNCRQAGGSEFVKVTIELELQTVADRYSRQFETNEDNNLSYRQFSSGACYVPASLFDSPKTEPV